MWGEPPGDLAHSVTCAYVGWTMTAPLRTSVASETRIWRSAPPADTGHAMLQGFLGRCPHCGKGRMFRAFLKVADHCPHCGEELHHHRADDFPAYLVILLVGHLIVPQVWAVETLFHPPEWVHFALWLPLTALLALLLIQPVKGAIVGLQWAAGMHGFEDAKKKRDPSASIHG